MLVNIIHHKNSKIYEVEWNNPCIKSYLFGKLVSILPSHQLFMK
jgi:hypothetical protein